MDLENRTVFDVGANVGIYSILFANAGAKKVTAFEPGPYYERLKENIKLNQLEKVISAHRLGISKYHTRLSWHEDLNNIGNAHLLPKDHEFSENSSLSKKMELVNCMTLDFFWKQLGSPQVDLLKVDVEGMELEVLESAVKMLAATKPAIVVETHPEQNNKNVKIDEFLKNIHYAELQSISDIFQSKYRKAFSINSVYLPTKSAHKLNDRLNLFY